MADPFFSSVVLLVHCDGANGSTTFTDVSPIARALSAVDGPVAVSTAQAKFGTGSANLTGGGRIRTAPGSPDFDFGSTPFTIECWAYAGSVPFVQALVAQFNNTGGTDGWYFGAVVNNLAFWYNDGAGTQQQFASSTAIPTGAWHFYTVDRDAGGTLRIYLDGVVVASRSAPTFAASSVTTETNIGNSNRVTDSWTVGYIDEVRITKGVARYAGAFTPPTAPFDAFGVTDLRSYGLARETIGASDGELRARGLVRESVVVPGSLLRQMLVQALAREVVLQPAPVAVLLQGLAREILLQPAPIILPPIAGGNVAVIINTG